MSNKESIKLLEVGIDYITATSRSTAPITGLYAFGTHLIREQVQKGCKLRKTRALGYVGSSAGSCQVGIRHDGCIVRLSSEVAREHWNQTADLSDNVTRLDLQLTELPRDGPSARLRDIWRARGRRVKGMGRPSKFKAIMGEGGIETIMVGSRASERYMRIYDKGKESKMQQYQGALRWELEMKHDLARAFVEYLVRREDQEAQIVAEIAKFARDRANQDVADSDIAEFVRDEINSSQSLDQPATVLKSVAFLGVCIKPLILRLWRAGYHQEVLEAIGLDEYVLRKPAPGDE